jgi:alpha 1,2-mannosyltransferase
MLARNSEVDNAVKSIRALEDRFNRERHYPWTFLNDEPFTDDFMR